MAKAIDVLIVGGGMITNDQILPSVYHLQRIGVVGSIDICALNNAPLKNLRKNAELKQAFPDQSFTPHPPFSELEDRNFPELFPEVVAKRTPRQAVIVATPDQLHYSMVMEAISKNQHVLCVKPLALRYNHAAQIEKAAFEKGLFVAVEYHKRFDVRSLMARDSYRKGQFGEFKMGEAKMIEPFLYRHSNFQNWFTPDNSDPFTYVGCHYVDLVHFITGLKPIEVSVQGVKGKFPNGNEGYMWANGRVRFENDALLTVTNGLGYPDKAAGSNQQGLYMFCEQEDNAGLIEHNDQDRGVRYSYREGRGPGGSYFNFISPDYFRLVEWKGKGRKPVGYGFESIAASINAMCDLEDVVEGMNQEESLRRRRKTLRQIDAQGLIATPANGYTNELVIEAGRMSLLRDGRAVRISYGDHPFVELIP